MLLEMKGGQNSKGKKNSGAFRKLCFQGYREEARTCRTGYGGATSGSKYHPHLQAYRGECRFAALSKSLSQRSLNIEYRTVTIKNVILFWCYVSDSPLKQKGPWGARPAPCWALCSGCRVEPRKGQDWPAGCLGSRDSASPHIETQVRSRHTD